MSVGEVNTAANQIKHVCDIRKCHSLGTRNEAEYALNVGDSMTDDVLYFRLQYPL
jgi:hypothetical protein